MEQPGSVAWRFACPDWAARLKDGRSLVPDLPLNEAAANRAVDIFNMLRLPDVVGQPPLSEAAGDWHRDIVRAVFGSLDRKGRRMVPEVFSLVPKKNAKTTGGAAIMLTAMLLNKRPRAEFLFVGPTQEVADLAFQQAAGMIDADPEGYLQKRFLLQEHIKTITDRLTKSKLKIKTFDMKVMTGAKPAGVLVDELHLMSSMSYALRVVGQIRGGMIANPEAFLIFISTQSDTPPAGVFLQELDHARGIRDGKMSGRMLPLLYEFPEAMQRDGSWRDTRNWPMVLPNLGRSITLDRVIADHLEAKAKGEAEERRWATQHLNVEIGVALRSDGWAGAEVWDRGIEPGLTLDEILRRSEVVTIGVDGGGLDDLLGVGLIGRERGTKRWLGWAHALISDIGIERRKANAAHYATFEREGSLTKFNYMRPETLEVAQPLNIQFVVDLVEKVQKMGLLAQVGVDAAGIGAIVDALGEIGVTQDAEKLDAVRQGIGLMGAVKTIEIKLADYSFRHGGSALMAWCVGNIKVVPTPTAMRIARDESGYGKVDPFMALANAAHLMGLNPKREPEYQMYFVA